MRTYATEFPDFPADALPAIPPAMVDESWHNDACPSFYDAAGRALLWVDYPDPMRRDNGPDMPRFAVLLQLRDDDGAIVLEQPDGTAYEGDEWAEALTAYERIRRVTMGQRLAEILRETLSPRALAACAAGRADPPDFIDDNFCTMEAYEATFGGDFDCGEDEQAARANVATVLAARLIRGHEMTMADMLATVAHDFPKGLAATITRDGALDANVAQCLEG